MKRLKPISFLGLMGRPSVSIHKLSPYTTCQSACRSKTLATSRKAPGSKRSSEHSQHRMSPLARLNPLSEKARRVKRGGGLHLCVRCAFGGSRPFAHPARGTKEASGSSYV